MHVAVTQALQTHVHTWMGLMYKSWMREMTHARAAASGAAGTRSGPCPRYFVTRYCVMTCSRSKAAQLVQKHAKRVILTPAEEAAVMSGKR